jgi:hypothetical protein
VNRRDFLSSTALVPFIISLPVLAKRHVVQQQEIQRDFFGWASLLHPPGVWEGTRLTQRRRLYSDGTLEVEVVEEAIWYDFTQERCVVGPQESADGR